MNDKHQYSSLQAKEDLKLRIPRICIEKINRKLNYNALIKISNPTKNYNPNFNFYQNSDLANSASKEEISKIEYIQTIPSDLNDSLFGKKV